MKRKNLLAKGILFSLGVLLALSLGTFTAFGQAGTSTIRGAVTDPQGNVVSGGTVTLTDLTKNTSRTATTDDNGNYRFELVPVGDYKLEVEAKGFKKAVIANVHAAVDDVR